MAKKKKVDLEIDPYVAPSNLDTEETEAEKQAVFLLLFYREHLSRLANRFIGDYQYVRADERPEPKEFGDYLHSLIQRAEDDTRCNDVCKGMYFCNKKKGHKGGHTCGVGLYDTKGLGPW